MKNLNLIKWLVDLADSKPLIFSVTILLVAVSVMGTVIVNRDHKIDHCDQEKKEISKSYNLRIDSINRAHEVKMIELNTELKQTLFSIIQDAKNALEEQKTLNQKINTTISRTSKLIKRNRTRIKNLR